MAGFMDMLSGIGGWLGGSTNGVSNALGAIGAAGNLWGAYNQNKMAKKQFNLQQDAYNFNKMLSQRQIRKEDEADDSLKNAWTNSSYATA